jgi:hypothetical protein
MTLSQGHELGRRSALVNCPPEPPHMAQRVKAPGCPIDALIGCNETDYLAEDYVQYDKERGNLSCQK